MDAPRAQFVLVSESAAAGEGRRAVSSVLTSWGLPQFVVEDAVLIVSELVTNAVVHGRDAVALELEMVLGEHWLRVSLADGSTARPLAREATDDDENGRGMAIVAALSDRRGVEHHQGGKRVWFEVDLARMSPTGPEQVADNDWDAAHVAASMNGALTPLQR